MNIGLLWYTYFNKPLFDFLVLLSKLLFNNLGLGIVALTILIRLVLVPLTIPSLRYTKKMTEIKPKLDEIKKQYGSDKKKVAEEQSRLLKEHNLNPLAGCLPNILQLAVLLTLYQVFISGLHSPGISTDLLVWDVSKPDKLYILPVLAGLSQFVYAKMLTPAIEKHPSLETKQEKKEGIEDMATTMQSQMLYLMPIMTVVIASALPSGLSLYWVVTTVFQIIQQYFVSGPGGLKSWQKMLMR